MRVPARPTDWSWQRDQRVAAVPDHLVDRGPGSCRCGRSPGRRAPAGTGPAAATGVALDLRPEPGIRRGRPRVVSHRWGGGERNERRVAVNRPEARMGSLLCGSKVLSAGRPASAANIPCGRSEPHRAVVVHAASSTSMEGSSTCPASTHVRPPCSNTATSRPSWRDYERLRNDLLEPFASRRVGALPPRCPRRPYRRDSGPAVATCRPRPPF